MDEVLYVFSLGFSGSDATRALILLLLGSLFVSTRLPPWKMTLFLLSIDLLWPYIEMLREGGGPKAVEIVLRGYVQTWQDTLAGFLVRVAGFYVVIRGIFSLRRKLHNAFPESAEKKGALPF